MLNIKLHSCRNEGKINSTYSNLQANLVHFLHACKLCTSILELLNLQTLRLREGLQLSDVVLAPSQSLSQLTDPLLWLPQGPLEPGKHQKQETGYLLEHVKAFHKHFFFYSITFFPKTTPINIQMLLSPLTDLLSHWLVQCLSTIVAIWGRKKSYIVKIKKLFYY